MATGRKCRVCKDPAVRKAEILHAADKLFRDKGYENTAVSDIVKDVGVSQGTFYYYYKTKEEILDALLMSVWEQLSAVLSRIADAKDRSVIARLKQILMMLFQPETQESWACWFKEPPKGETERLHTRCNLMRDQYVKPHLQLLVMAGMSEGVFEKAEFPDVLIEIVFNGITRYMHEHCGEFCQPQVYMASMTTLDELLSKVLGIHKGILLDIPSTPTVKIAPVATGKGERQ